MLQAVHGGAFPRWKAERRLAAIFESVNEDSKIGSIFGGSGETETARRSDLTRSIASNGETEPRTLNEATYHALRAAILSCDLKPGERLLFEALKARYDVGTSPLREAMTRLASEGLIIFESHKGARVAPISMGDFLDLVAMRQFVECEALRRAIKLGDDHWEARLVSTYHYYLKASANAAAVSGEREQRHRDFHHALASACGSKRLLETREVFYVQSERYRLLGLAYRHLQKKRRDGVTEHREIMEHALAREADAACERLSAHLARTIEEVTFALKNLNVAEDDDALSALPAKSRRRQSASAAAD
jgi:GntR family carbon starvation induced transcriptional regulator